MSVQHLQQQIIQRHFVLALHAVEMLHAFVAAEKEEFMNPSVNEREFRLVAISLLALLSS